MGMVGGNIATDAQGADHRGAARHHTAARAGRPGRPGRPQRRRQVDAAAAAVRASTSRPAGRRRSGAGWRRSSTSASAWTRRSPAARTSSIRGLFLGHDPQADGGPGRRHRGLHRARRLPADAAADLLHRHARAAGARAWSPASTRRSCSSTRASARSTRRSWRSRKNRLAELVERAGLLVFASHSDEFLRELCDTAIWMEHGRIRAAGRARARCCAGLQGPRVGDVPAGGRRPGAVVAVVVTRAPPRAARREPGRARRADPAGRPRRRRRQRPGRAGRGRRRRPAGCR